jgi:hypothetical protein
MSRNSSGNYTLPTGNPVVPGTTISTVWANATLGDLSAEMTDSLNRSGKGAMLAPLKATDGTVTAPSLTFANDPDSGLYRVSDNVVAMGANATQVQRWTTTGSTFPSGATFTGTATFSGTTVATTIATFQAGVAVSNTTTNGNGVSVTANGTGVGLDGTGGATSGYGVRGTGGAPNGQGVVGMGTGSGYGVEGVGGPTSGGGIFTPGTASTAAVRSNAVVAYTGDILFSTTANPDSNVALINRLTPMNVPKAWANITTTGSGSTVATINAGCNVTSAAVIGTGNRILITFASAFASTAYAVMATAEAQLFCAVSGIDKTTTAVGIFGYTDTGAQYDFDSAASVTINVIVFGAQ